MTPCRIPSRRRSLCRRRRSGSLGAPSTDAQYGAAIAAIAIDD
ncbi:hypothetical protein ACWC0A_39550 [Streptomyces scopuliridis]